MLLLSKKELKKRVGNKYILLLRTCLDELIDIMNELDRLSPDQYEPIGDIHCGIFFDWVVMRKKD